jgi:hypothetical protein
MTPVSSGWAPRGFRLTYNVTKHPPPLFSKLVKALRSAEHRLANRSNCDIISTGKELFLRNFFLLEEQGCALDKDDAQTRAERKPGLTMERCPQLPSA